jgi:hypothetical protein
LRPRLGNSWVFVAAKDKSWSFKEKHQVELWDFMKKNDRAIGCALVLEICAKFGADMFGDRDFWCQNAAK